MKRIKLTQNKFTIVDDSDYEWLNQYKWYFSQQRGSGYSHRTPFINGKKKMVSMHRFILGVENNMEVDHINGNGLDNRRSNLRISTHQQNICNQKLRFDNTSGYKGVSLDKRYRKWKSFIYTKNKQHGLGYYSNIKEAAKAYNQAALKYFGEFARLNII